MSIKELGQIAWIEKKEKKKKSQLHEFIFFRSFMSLNLGNFIMISKIGISVLPRDQNPVSPLLSSANHDFY
jgi:hypothetical protein